MTDNPVFTALAVVGAFVVVILWVVVGIAAVSKWFDWIEDRDREDIRDAWFATVMFLGILFVGVLIVVVNSGAEEGDVPPCVEALR